MIIQNSAFGWSLKMRAVNVHWPKYKIAHYICTENCGNAIKHLAPSIRFNHSQNNMTAAAAMNGRDIIVEMSTSWDCNEDLMNLAMKCVVKRSCSGNFIIINCSHRFCSQCPAACNARIAIIKKNGSKYKKRRSKSLKIQWVQRTESLCSRYSKWGRRIRRKRRRKRKQRRRINDFLFSNVTDTHDCIFTSRAKREKNCVFYTWFSRCCCRYISQFFSLYLPLAPTSAKPFAFYDLIIILFCISLFAQVFYFYNFCVILSWSFQAIRSSRRHEFLANVLRILDSNSKY